MLNIELSINVRYIFRSLSIWGKFINGSRELAWVCKLSTNGMIWHQWKEQLCWTLNKSTSAHDFSRTPLKEFMKFYARFNRFSSTWRLTHAVIWTSHLSSWTNSSSLTIGWSTVNTKTWWIIHTNCFESWQTTRNPENKRKFLQH